MSGFSDGGYISEIDRWEVVHETGNELARIAGMEQDGATRPESEDNYPRWWRCQSCGEEARGYAKIIPYICGRRACYVVARITDRHWPSKPLGFEGHKPTESIHGCLECERNRKDGERSNATAGHDLRDYEDWERLAQGQLWPDGDVR